MNHAQSLQEISFDLYERYILLEHIGKFFRPHDSNYRVLDVGGDSAAFWPGFSPLAGVLIPDAGVVVVDTIPTSELENYVQSSRLQLPFRDGAFDLVCSLDTLEHIPPPHRPAFLSELLRVTRDGLYLVFPFDSETNRWAESILVEFANVELKDSIPALLEHRNFGLPDRGCIERVLSHSPFSWVGFARGNTDVWLLMMLTYQSLRKAGPDFVLEFNRRFNQIYAAQDWTDPAYRAGYLLSKHHSVADLETVRTAFLSEKRADFQSVLSLCRFFLSVAQNGRINVDKDRHILNIEGELADASSYKRTWSDVAAVLHDLELTLLDPPPAEAPGEALADWPRERIDALLDATSKLRSGVHTELDKKILYLATQLETIREHIDSLPLSQLDNKVVHLAAQMETIREQIGLPLSQLDNKVVHLAAQLKTIREQIGLPLSQLDTKIFDLAAQLETIRKRIDDLPLSQIGAQLTRHLETIAEQVAGLESRLALQTRLNTRMLDLEIGLATNKRAVQGIYDSRIWKALCRVGALLLRVTGRTTQPEPSGLWTQQHERVPQPPRQDATDEFRALVCDYPTDGGVLPVRDIIELRGWALAASGIDQVLIQINNHSPLAASYGIPRSDVARNHPEIPGSSESGYRFMWDTTGLEGPCTVRVKAIARSGQTQELIRTVLIDWQRPPGYSAWIASHEPGIEELHRMRLNAVKFAVRPRISIAVPVYKTPIALITRCIESVLGQTYSNWELCLADDGTQDATLASLLQDYVQRDSRIRLVTLRQNRGISGATNEALHLCTGEYVAFLDHDDELAAFALFEVVRAINDDPEIELYYSDEDKIDEQGRRYDAFFKPDWSPDLFLSCNYLCHLVVMKRSLLDRVGNLDENYSGAQDYEFLLRATEHTQKIKRIPKVLYHWRAAAGSAAKALAEKPEASGDGKRALASYLARNAPGAQVEEVGPCRYRVRYPIVGDPQVTILIPTGGHRNVFRAVEAVLDKTAYKHYDILLIDNSRSARVKEYADRFIQRKAPVRYFDWRDKPFNFSRMNNAAARTATAPYVLFLNDDTSIIESQWLTAMLEHAQRPEVGAVGAQLWYPNDAIQHAGVVMGLFGNCSHAFKGLPGELSHYGDFASLIRNYSAVTGACLLIARQKFFEAGAFDETNLAVAFQDVDLCLKLLELGYRNVYTPYAKLYHCESATKTENDKIPDALEDAFMKDKWAKYIADDPYYNPNLARRREDFSLAID